MTGQLFPCEELEKRRAARERRRAARQHPAAQHVTLDDPAKITRRTGGWLLTPIGRRQKRPTAHYAVDTSRGGIVTRCGETRPVLSIEPGTTAPACPACWEPPE